VLPRCSPFAMDEIYALQAALAKAQLADTAHRISERNAVEIVLKLMELKKVQLLFTKSGREYVTPAHVVEELDMELVAAGGRVTLTDVAPLLGLDLTHVEVAAKTLLAKKGKKLTEVAGQVVADYYLDSIVEEINETLQQAGSVALLDLAQRYALPADMMRAAIEQRMGPGGVQGYVEDGQLYTATFIEQHQARTRGVMRGLVRPTPLRALIQRHGLLESRLSKEIQQLIKDGAIAGSLKGAADRAIYTPDLFLRAQHAGVDSFFATNGYVEFSKVERLSVANPKAFLSSKYPTAMQLSSMALSEGLVSAVTLSCEDALSANLFVHAQSLLPSVLSRAEVSQVLAASVAQANKSAPAMEKNASLAVLAETWAVSSVFREQCQKALEAQLNRWMEEETAKMEAAAAAASAVAASASAAAATPAAASAPAKRGKAVVDSESEDEQPAAGKKGAKAASKSAAGKKGSKGKHADSEDEEDAPAAKGKKKRRAGKKGADSDSDDDAPAAAEPAPASKSKSKGKSSSGLTVAPLARDRVLKWLKAAWSSIVRKAQAGNADAQSSDAVTDESTDELLSALATAIHPSLLAQHKTTMAARAAAIAAAAAGASASVSSSSSSGLGPASDALLRRQQIECFRANAQEQYEQIVQYQHAIDYLAGSATAEEKAAAAASPLPPASAKADRHLLSQLESHLCKTLCAGLTDLLLRMEAFASLTLAQQNHLPGMDNIIVLAAAPAAQSAEEKDMPPAAKAMARFDINRTPLSNKDRDAVLAALPKRAADALRSVAETLSKEPTLFLERLESTAKALDLSLKKLDKKSERSRVFAVRKALMASAAAETKPAVALHLAVLLMFAKQHSVVPHAPAKTIPAIRRILRPDVQPTAYARLRRYNQLVLRSLRAADEEGSAPASSSAAAAASVLGGASDSEDEAADGDLPLEQQVKHLSAAAVAQELESGLELIRGYAQDPATALKAK